jgi:hypothetical protein
LLFVTLPMPIMMSSVFFFVNGLFNNTVSKFNVE